MSVIPRRNVTAFPAILRRVVRFGFAGARQALEDRFARRFGYLACLATSSGRHGLDRLLKAARPLVTPRAYVPALTIPAVPEIARNAGYDVVFVDMDPDSFALTPDVVRRDCTRPGILIVTHYFGLPADMERIMALTRDRGIEVIEDCAHAPCGRVGDGFVGSFGLGGFFSFETRKPLNGLGGGMVVTSDPRMEALLRLHRDDTAPSPLHDARRLLATSAEWLALRRPVFRLLAPVLHRPGGRDALVSLYRGLHAGSRSDRFAFSDLQAALVLDQMDSLDGSVAAKRSLARLYDSALPRSFVRAPDPPDRPHGYYMYVVRHPQAETRGAFLRRHGVDCGIGSEVLACCAPPGEAPGSKAFVASAVELPMHDDLTVADVARVCSVAALADSMTDGGFSRPGG